MGTLVGVRLGLTCLPLGADAPLLLWGAASLAMIIYAVPLPEGYDIACGTFALCLVTMAVPREHSMAVRFARAWKVLLGCTPGLAAAFFLFPLRAREERKSTPHKESPDSDSPLPAIPIGTCRAGNHANWKAAW